MAVTAGGAGGAVTTGDLRYRNKHTLSIKKVILQINVCAIL